MNLDTKNFTPGGTIGTAPWDESCKRRRTAVGTIMTRPAIQKSAPMLDQELTALVKDMFRMGKGQDGNKDSEIDPRILFQRLSLNVTLMMCFFDAHEGNRGLLLDNDTQKLTKGKTQFSAVLNFIRYVVFILPENS